MDISFSYTWTHPGGRSAQHQPSAKTIILRVARVGNLIAKLQFGNSGAMLAGSAGLIRGGITLLLASLLRNNVKIKRGTKEQISTCFMSKQKSAQCALLEVLKMWPGTPARRSGESFSLRVCRILVKMVELVLKVVLMAVHSPASVQEVSSDPRVKRPTTHVKKTHVRMEEGASSCPVILPQASSAIARMASLAQNVTPQPIHVSQTHVKMEEHAPNLVLMPSTACVLHMASLAPCATSPLTRSRTNGGCLILLGVECRVRGRVDGINVRLLGAILIWMLHPEFYIFGP